MAEETIELQPVNHKHLHRYHIVDRICSAKRSKSPGYKEYDSEELGT